MSTWSRPFWKSAVLYERVTMTNWTLTNSNNNNSCSSNKSSNSCSNKRRLSNSSKNYDFHNTNSSSSKMMPKVMDQVSTWRRQCQQHTHHSLFLCHLQRIIGSSSPFLPKKECLKTLSLVLASPLQRHQPQAEKARESTGMSHVADIVNNQHSQEMAHQPPSLQHMAHTIPQASPAPPDLDAMIPPLDPHSLHMQEAASIVVEGLCVCVCVCVCLSLSLSFFMCGCNLC